MIRSEFVTLISRWAKLVAVALVIAWASLAGNAAAESGADPSIVRQDDHAQAKNELADKASPRTPLAGGGVHDTLWGRPLKSLHVTAKRTRRHFGVEFLCPVGG
jgi:hypothetical protein